MPKIKLTKSELKSQRDNLKQFTRFLPTLQLKKQQLQMEMRKCAAHMDELTERENEAKRSVGSWISLFADDKWAEFLKSSIVVEEIETETRNIAGIDVPEFKAARFADFEPDLFSTPPWIDDAVEAVRTAVSLKAERDIIKRQYDLIARELRVTTQRVNLFEKVKIPECKDNIRVIQIYLGDQQTAAVGRSKIAKRKMQSDADGVEVAA
ncbi:MAG: V-type ATP synthase subunit D [Kiritimatiellaeota bacterium]|nr:V-type ATP synthase subunit D [Kiritimatiellota bacterium]